MMCSFNFLNSVFGLGCGKGGEGEDQFVFHCQFVSE